jgi:hypothetical protein
MTDKIEERFTDLEIKFLFTKHFIWHNTLDREIFQGLPAIGRVYRDLYNPKSGNHKLKMPGVIINEHGIALEGLAIKDLNESGHDYDCEFVEITLGNILDLDILEADLDLLNVWMSTGNKDLEQLYEEEPQPLNKLKKALHNHNQEEAEALAMGTNAIMNLWSANPLKFDIVMGLIEYLTEADFESYEDIANHIRHHPTSGKGVNISQALRALDRYNSDNRRVGEDIADLFIAAEAIITEMERKIGNNLTE